MPIQYPQKIRKGVRMFMTFALSCIIEQSAHVFPSFRAQELCDPFSHRKSGLCQEFILDTEALDTRFDQCLRGFCVLKIVPTLGCGILAGCGTMKNG